MSNQPFPIPGAPSGVVVVRQRYWPAVTFVILATNVVVFLLMTLAGGSKNIQVLLDFGASYGPFIRRGEYWRLVMPMFLHIGLLHLLVNSYALYILGPILERVYGYGRFAFLYVLTGVASSFLSMSLSNNVAAGASGAIFGISDAMLVTGYLHRSIIPRHWGRAFGKGILPFIVLNLALGFTIPHIDNWAHLGGLVGGIGLALLIPPPGHDLQGGAYGERPSQAIAVVPAVIVALAMLVTAAHYRDTQAMGRLLQDGARLQAAQRMDQALERLRAAARLSPKDERPHLAMGSLYLAKRDLDNALREYQTALSLSPDSPEAQLGLGIAYQMKGDFAKARLHLEAALGKNPDNPEAQEILADFYAAQKLYPDAIKHYLEALRLNPNFALAHNNLAWLYATSEDPQSRNPHEALTHALRAVELSQWKVPGYIDTLAEAYFAAGQFSEAVKIQTKALQLDPANAEFQQHMARYRKAAGV